MQINTGQLERFELLAGLPEGILAHIGELAQEERRAGDDLLFVEGEPAKALYLILEGKVSLEKRVQLGRTGTARRATIGVVGPGNGQAPGHHVLVPDRFDLFQAVTFAEAIKG